MDYAFDSIEEAMEKTMRAVQVMLADFPTLRIIKTLSDMRSDEYAILFRLSSDGDFHYLKRDNIGHWYHKRGGRHHIDTMKAKFVFEKWYPRYNGPIIMFAKQRKGCMQ